MRSEPIKIDAASFIFYFLVSVLLFFRAFYVWSVFDVIFILYAE